jgi:hypothetical protein
VSSPTTPAASPGASGVCRLQDCAEREARGGCSFEGRYCSCGADGAHPAVKQPLGPPLVYHSETGVTGTVEPYVLVYTGVGALSTIWRLEEYLAGCCVVAQQRAPIQLGSGEEREREVNGEVRGRDTGEAGGNKDSSCDWQVTSHQSACRRPLLRFKSPFHDPLLTPTREVIARGPLLPDHRHAAWPRRVRVRAVHWTHLAGGLSKTAYL